MNEDPQNNRAKSKYTNRDIQRQNKASSIINATLHIHIAKDLIKESDNLACDILDSESSLSHSTKRKLKYISKLAKTTVEVVEEASSKHCKSSS